VDALANRGLPPRLADQLEALATPIANGVQRYTRTQVGKVVQSQAFADAWVQANRAAQTSSTRCSPPRAAGRSPSRTTP
jgi:hypothetical protein